MRPICQAFNRRRSPSSSRLASGEANLPIKLLRATLAPSRFVKKSSDQVLGSIHQALRSKISHHQDLQRKLLPIKFWEEPIKLLGTKSCHETLEANPSSSTLGTIQYLQAFLFFSLHELLGYLLDCRCQGFHWGCSLSLLLPLFSLTTPHEQMGHKCVKK
jgi:hypothetical protein